jgi:hypothetical protein
MTRQNSDLVLFWILLHELLLLFLFLCDTNVVPANHNPIHLLQLEFGKSAKDDIKGLKKEKETKRDRDGGERQNKASG